jgi:hypothetical protein
MCGVDRDDVDCYRDDDDCSEGDDRGSKATAATINASGPSGTLHQQKRNILKTRTLMYTKIYNARVREKLWL